MQYRFRDNRPTVDLIPTVPQIKDKKEYDKDTFLLVFILKRHLINCDKQKSTGRNY
jgi:hypothetical protein